MVEYVLAAWAGLLAAAVSWLSNSIFVGLAACGKAVVYLAPAVEESAKTGLAVLLGAPIWLTHLTFGFLEALWDITGGGKRGIYAGLAGLAGHLFFGLAAFFIFQATGFFWLALAGGYVLHLSWNAFVVFKLS